MRDAQAEEEPPLKFSLFDMKGNSKAKEQAPKFNFMSLPEFKPSSKSINLFKITPSPADNKKEEESKVAPEKPVIKFTFTPHP